MRRYILFLFLIVNFFLANSQIHNGSIIFERKTNLKKMYGQHLPSKWSDYVKQPKIDSFILLFNDSISLFKPIETNEVDILGWSINRNIIYTNLMNKEKKAILTFYNEKYLIENLKSNKNDWKITQEIREIAGFTCIKSFKVVNGEKVYAWFCPYINPAFGPEGFEGLPGMILGIAFEDGRITYFARKVFTVDDIENISMPVTDVVSVKSNISDFEKQFINVEMSEIMSILLNDILKWF